MHAKALLIPLAAFALTATGVSAFNGNVLVKAGLSQEQISAFEQAHELRKEGDKESARAVLEEAGINLETMESVRKAMHEYKDSMRTSLDAAVAAEDYEAFKAAIEGSPLADIITTKEDFIAFSDAHNLHKEGEHEAAREIMEDLGLKPGFGHKFGHMMHHENHTNVMQRINAFKTKE
jgi:hypothetical protein